jgi:hypothetical protein
MDLKGFESEKDEKKVVGRRPDFKGSLSCAGWIEETQDGNRYLNVRIGNALYVKLFPNGDEKK